MGLIRGIFEWLIGTVGVIILVYVIGPWLNFQFIPAAQTLFYGIDWVLGQLGANWLQFYTGQPPAQPAQFFVYWFTFTGFIYLLLWVGKLIVIGYRSNAGRSPPSV